MSAKKCECCVGSCKTNNYSPSYQKDAASEDYFQANMWYHYYCWRNYHSYGYLGGGKHIESDSATWCVTCVEEQRMREERVSRSMNRQTSNANNYQTSSSSKFNSHEINNIKSDEMVHNNMSQHTEEILDLQYEDDHNDEFEMELNNDFRRFLEQSARHKQQRKEEKEAQLAKAEIDDYIEVNEIALEATSIAPTQQQGVLRTQEMKILYGRAAHHIESLETSLQLHFNMNVDMRHPVFWPSIPLKF